MGKSQIQWTDDTDNIIVVKGGGWWCRKISDGCKNCYAAKLNQSSYFGGNKLPYSGKPPELELRRALMAGWARQTRPRKHFVASMTDVFGEWVKFEWVRAMLDAMGAAPRQTFQVLTKRTQGMGRDIRCWLVLRGLEKLPENIWIGTSVENQATADERIPELLKIPAAVRFLSVEPMLSAVQLHGRVSKDSPCPKTDLLGRFEGGGPNLIDWIICGGESGPNARPMHPEWARDLRDQCQKTGVPFFFKQWGEWVSEQHCRNYIGDCSEMIAVSGHWQVMDRSGRHPVPNFDGPTVSMVRVGKKKAGRLLDGREWSEFPKVGGLG